MNRNAMRAMAILCVLSSPMGCQVVKRLMNRGQDSGTAAPATPTPVTPTAVEVDAGSIAVPNPTVAPMPSADDAGTPAMPTAEVDAGAPAAPTAAAEVDAGAPAAPPPPAPPAVDPNAAPVPTIAAPVEGPRRPRGPRNYCKDHPGQRNPLTGEVCPLTAR